MHRYQYEQFDVSYLDFIKLAFSNQRFRNLIGQDDIKIFTSNRPYILLSLMKMSTPEEKSVRGCSRRTVHVTLKD